TVDTRQRIGVKPIGIGYPRSMIVTLHDFTRLLHRFTGLNLAGQDRSKSLDPSRITELQLHEEKQDAIPAHRRIAYR
ncbi:hypothetical protein ABHI18_002676, partial [Aspergillus niger]